MGYIAEHISTLLFGLGILLSLVEAWMRWVTPSFRKDPANAKVVETVDSIWVALVVALSFKAILIENFTIPSGSMENTLLINDYVLVKKYEYGYSLFNKTPRFLQFNKPRRREIIVFQGVSDPSKDLIKRCIGIPGDVIEYKKKELYVNGEKQVEPYAIHGDARIDKPGQQGPYTMEQHPDPNGPLGDYSKTSRDNFGPVTVAAGHYFMMGDNRDNSWDSRYWGQMDEKLIKGRAWVIYWHSVTLLSLVALLGLGISGICFLVLVFSLATSAFKKMRPVDGTNPPQFFQENKELIIWTGIALVVAWVMISRMGGWPEFKDSLSLLGSRIFTLIH